MARVLIDTFSGSRRGSPHTRANLSAECWNLSSQASTGSSSPPPSIPKPPAVWGGEGGAFCSCPGGGERNLRGMDHPPFPAAEWKVDTQRPRGAVCRNVPVNTRRGAGAEMLFLGQVGREHGRHGAFWGGSQCRGTSRPHRGVVLQQRAGGKQVVGS